jgi:HSP20 family protein
MYLWNPWSIFDELQRTMVSSSEWPQFDIEDSEDETVLTADVPGLREDDIEIVTQGPYLFVRGDRKATSGRYLRRRRFYGSFERQFHVGDAYDLDHVRANLQDGVLTIRLEKAAKAKPRRIPLTTGVIDKVRGLLGGKQETEKAA